MHFSRQQCQDVLDFMTAALHLSEAGKRGRSALLLDGNSPAGNPKVESVGSLFDGALGKVAAIFGMTFTPSEEKPTNKNKKGKKS